MDGLAPAIRAATNVRNSGQTKLQPLTRPQAEAVRDRIGPLADYLQRLNARLRALGYDDSTPLLHDVVHASTRVTFLHLTLQAMTDPKTGEQARAEAATPRKRHVKPR
jgi:hypothetical protein